MSILLRDRIWLCRRKRRREALRHLSSPSRWQDCRRANVPRVADRPLQPLARSAAPFGVTGLETALPIALMVAAGDPQLVVRWLSCNPASVMGWKDAGVLRVGASADITIFDPAEEWTFTASESKSKSKNSPFIGKRLRGRVQYTIVDGCVMWS